MEGEIVVKKISMVIAAIIVVVSSQVTVLALDTTTHMLINRYIAETPVVFTQDANNNPLATFSLDTYLKSQLGMNNGVKEAFYSNNQYENSKAVFELLRDGGEYEDAPPENIIPYRRSRNHFHNPLLPLEQAGYTGFMAFCSPTDNPLLISGHCPQSAILWANGPQISDAVFS